MKLSIPGLCFITSKVPLTFDTDGHATLLQPLQEHQGNPEHVLVLTDVHVQMFGLKSVQGVSVFDTIMVPGNFKFPEIYDGTQDLSSKSILVLMLNGWGDMILIQPALRTFYEKASSSGDPPQITLGCNWMHNFPYPGEPFIHDIRPNIMTLQDLGAFDLLVNLIPVNHQRSRHKSMKDLCFEIMKLNGNDAKSLRPSIVPDPDKILKIRPFIQKLREETGKKLICVNWKSRFLHKDAPPSLFYNILTTVAGEYQAVLFKDALAAKIMQKEIDAVNLPVENLSHLIQDYHDTIAALSLVDAFLSVDTGIVHAAGALGVPGVALFGPFPPETHVADYPSVTGFRAEYAGKACQGPCLETYRGCAEVDFSQDAVSPCFQAISADVVVNAFEKAGGQIFGKFRQKNPGKLQLYHSANGPI